MIVKKIPYVDYNGVERIEEAWFHLNEAELTELELTTKGGFVEYVQRIINAADQPALVKIFKEIIKMSYGIKSPDGRRMDKSEELFKEFSQTEAYSKLFMELATDAHAAAEFVKGVVPADYRDKIDNDEDVKKILEDNNIKA